MNSSAEIGAWAIRKLFDQSPNGLHGTMDVRRIYRLWTQTGLRREDLINGIFSLSENGKIHSNFRHGGCQLRFIRAAEPTRIDQQGDVLTLRKLDAPTRRHAFSADDRRHLVRAEPMIGEQPDERRQHRSGRLLALLAGSAISEFDRVISAVELVPMHSGDVLWERGDSLQHLYFPINAVLSKTHEMEDGFSCEMALVGNEGVAGLSAYMGSNKAPFRTLIVTNGFAHQMSISAFRKEFDRGGKFQDLMLKYSHALLMQVAYGAACNKHHAIGPQLCRYLLSMSDRFRSSKMKVTHDRIAITLGVRREGVTEHLRELSRMKLIGTARGEIALLNRAGIEARCCECYGLIRECFDSMRTTPPLVPGRTSAVSSPVH